MLRPRSSTPTVESLEARQFLAADIIQIAGPINRHVAVFAPDQGPAQIRAYNAQEDRIVQDYYAFDRAYQGGARIAVADVNNDGFLDVIVGSGKGSSHVKVFSGANADELFSFLAFPGPGNTPQDPTSDYYRLSFRGGVFVGGGDIDGDGFSDIVVGADAGAGPHVKAWSGQTGALIRSFFAYDPGFLGGVRVTVGDVTADGLFDIVTGTGSAGPHVKAFDSVGNVEIASFFAFDPGFLRGIHVGIGDLDDNGRDEIIVGTGDGPAHVKAFEMSDPRNPRLVESYFAFDNATHGVRVSSIEANADRRDDIVAGFGLGGRTVTIVDPDLGLLTTLDPYADYTDFTGGLWVAGNG